MKQPTLCFEISLACPSRTEYDSEIIKGAKFLQRSLNTFIASHGVQVGMGAESGARFMADDDFEARGKKQKQRKWSLILPLAVMLKLVHLKLLLKPILLGVGLIQVLLIAGGLLLFHFFRNTNICKIQPHVIHAHSHISSESSPGWLKSPPSKTLRQQG